MFWIIVRLLTYLFVGVCIGYGIGFGRGFKAGMQNVFTMIDQFKNFAKQETGYKKMKKLAY